MLANFNRKSEIKLILVVLLVYLILGSISLYSGKEKVDESKIHLPVLTGMYEVGFFDYLFSDNYNAANPPLPYIPVLWISRVLSVEPSLYLARIINFIISFITVLIFIRLYYYIKGTIDYGIMIFVFYPYLIKPSFTFYLSVYGTLFLLLSILLIRQKGKEKILASGFSTAAGILSQQFILAFPAAFTLYYVSIKIKQNVSLKYFQFILFYLPLIVPLVLFIIWGGLTQPLWRFHYPTIDITHLTAIFTITGGIFFPYLLSNIKTIKKVPLIVIAAISLILVCYFTPGWSYIGGFQQVTGYTFNFINKVGLISGILAFLIQILLCFSGIYLFYQLSILSKNHLEKILFFSAVLFLALFFFNTVFSERHLLPMISILFLLCIPKIKNKIILNGWIIFQILFGIIYFYYLFFVHTDF